MPDHPVSEPEAFAAWLARRGGYLHEARTQRINALIDHYGIAIEGRETDAVLFDLVSSLAEDFVPGFRITGDRPKGGRPKTWNFSAVVRLFYLVEERRARSNWRRSPHDACTSLAGEGQPYSDYRGDTLYRLYLKFKKERPALVRLATLAAQSRSDEIQVQGFRPTIKVSG